MGASAEQFNKDLLGDNIQWFDKVGLYRVNDKNTAKIILSTRLKDGRFVGHKLTIINRVNGIIDGKFFNFNDYVLPKREYAEYHVVHDKETKLYEWNIEPEDLKAYKEAIFKYIAYF